jgi:hypothetical protein
MKNDLYKLYYPIPGDLWKPKESESTWAVRRLDYGGLYGSVSLDVKAQTYRMDNITNRAMLFSRLDYSFIREKNGSQYIVKSKDLRFYKHNEVGEANFPTIVCSPVREAYKKLLTQASEKKLRWDEVGEDYDHRLPILPIPVIDSENTNMSIWIKEDKELDITLDYNLSPEILGEMILENLYISWRDTNGKVYGKQFTSSPDTMRGLRATEDLVWL